jgi:N-methylhydantoinase B
VSGQPNPVTVAVVRNYLLAAAREMRDTIQRTAVSPIIYDNRDFNCGLLDGQAGTMAEAPGLTHFMGSLSPGVKRSLASLAGQALEPCDVFVVAMPEFTGAHPPDTVVFAPIFEEGHLVAFAGSKAHLVDLGAKDPYPTDSTDAFQEGLRLPPTKLFAAGKLLQPVADIIRANSRAPQTIWGDLMAEVAALNVGRRSIEQLMRKYGRETVGECIQAIYRHSEELTRAAIRKLPAGTWVGRDRMDDNGVEHGKPVRIEVSLTINPVAGELVFDYSGSDPVQAGPTNCPLFTTISISRLMGKALTDPDSPGNEGSFRPFRVIAPEGNMFNPGTTAPTMLYGWPARAAVETMLKTLAPVFPDRVPTCSGGCLVGVLRFGTHPETGRMWLEGPLEAVGQGGSARGDGETAISHILSACSTNLPVEIEEAMDPIFVERYEIRADSGGPGRHRGGLGVVRDLRFEARANIISVIERGVAVHWGAEGGWPGSRNYAVLTSQAGGEREILKLPATPVAAGDRISIRAGGGGGFGDPLDRDPEAVRLDVRDGYVSMASAKEEYGVVFSEDGRRVDADATRALRERLRGARFGRGPDQPRP